MNPLLRAWIVVFLVLVVGGSFVYSYPMYSRYKDLGLYSLTLFLFLALAVQLGAPILARHPNRQFFLSASIYNMLLKMICSFGLLFWYKQSSLPADGNFVVPFLFIYLVFTTFETWFLMRMAYVNPK